MLKHFSLLLLVVICFSIPAHADSYNNQEGAFSYFVSETGAVLTDWNGREIDEATSILVLPSFLGGSPLVGIGKNALSTVSFDGDLTKLEIIVPEGVTYLEKDAFEDCCHATAIQLPSTLRDIPEGCFFHVTAEISFPNGNVYFSCEDGFLVDISTSTLLYSSPSSYNNALPDIKRIGESSIDNWAYEKKDFFLPQTITSIGTMVFYDLPDLESLSLPSGVTEIDSHCFSCTGLMYVELPSSLKIIPPYCFTNCSLKSIHFPEGIMHISEFAFYQNWENIETITLPASVQFVGYQAFPEETQIITLNAHTHFETREEYDQRFQSSELKQLN